MKSKTDTINLLFELDYLVSHVPGSKLVSEILNFITDKFHFTRVSIIFYNPDESKYFISDSTFNIDGINSGQFLSNEDSSISKVVKLKKLIYRKDIRNSDNKGDHDDILLNNGILSDLAIPIIVEKECIGILNCGCGIVDGISDEVQQILSLIAHKFNLAYRYTKLLNEINKGELKYRQLFEKSGDAILIIENRKFIDCNQAAIDILKYSSAREIISLHPSELSPFKQPDGRESLEKANEMIETALRNGTHRFEWNHKKSNGDVFPVEVLLTAISDKQNKEVLHTVWRDITERKAALSELNRHRDNLESMVKERTKELESKNEELSKYHELFVSREFRIKELRDKLKRFES